MCPILPAIFSPRFGASRAKVSCHATHSTIALDNHNHLISQVSGLQNPANVLQTDIPACGPSLLQLTDAVLLPVNLTDYVTSRITPGDDNSTMAVTVAG